MPFQSFSAANLTVLVVDDIATTRMMLAGVVQKLGYRVLTAADGESALQIFAQQQPDMVLLDLLMPGLDGFEVTRRIRAVAGLKWVPVVVLSGLEGEQHLLAALEAGADDFLHKPAQPAILASKLKNLARVLVLQQQHAALLNQSMAMSENSFDAILVVDEHDIIQGLNLAAERLLVVDRDVMQGRSLRMVLPEIELAQQTQDPRQGHLQQLTVHPLSGETIPVEVGVTFFYQAGARFWLLILRDIRERERVDRLKQQFIATLSHELRTPLTSIIGSLKMLQSPQFAAVDARAAPLLQMADRNAARLLQMVNELLDLNKAAAGALQLEWQWCNLNELLTEAISSNQGYAAKYQVTLQLNNLLPPATLVNTDRTRLTQVLANLLSNACKYSPPQLAVEVSAAIADQALLIRVRDHGPGIPDSFLPSLFEPFTQADASDSRLRGGTGLGLAITRQICQALSAAVAYQPAPGGGSEFTVSLPVESVR
ncbi:response regulator [Chitinibacter sp. SCUT-21]|uniref:ATP-binding response regulator n=1 Tax=Chitinibacter sp. SCUT-21 TaxID=2970891 RepID=UPI0035A5DC79